MINIKGPEILSAVHVTRMKNDTRRGLGNTLGTRKNLVDR